MTREGEPIIRLSNKHESGAVSEALRVYELAEDRGTMKVITYSVFPELDPPRATYDVMVFTAYEKPAESDKESSSSSSDSEDD